MQPAKATFDDLYDVSDPEERSAAKAKQVKKPVRGRSTRNRSATPLRDQTPEADPVLESDNVDAMLAEHIEDSSSPAIETGRKVRATPGVDSSVLAIGKFKRRPRQQSILGRGPARDRSSSVASDMADDSGLKSVGRKDLSKFSVGKPKRRARELSVGPATSAVLPSSMALQMGTPAHVGSAMKIANFKRRAREPSILGTAQKARLQGLQYDLDDEDEDEDDFNPDDESTPLNLSRTKIMASASNPSSANSRKRKLSGVQVPQSSPRLPSPKPATAETVVQSTETQLEEEEQNFEASENIDEDELPVPSVEARPHTLEVLSDTMAPPLSSSSMPPSPQLPTRKYRAPSRGRRTQRNQTPPPHTQDSPISSPPSLTHSPNRIVHTTKAKPKQAAPPPSTLSTAQLQVLLPRRRRRAARDTFDIPSSEDEIDITGLSPEDDELSHIIVRPRPRRGNTVTRTLAPTKKASKAKPVSKLIAKAVSTKRTYGARANPASGKENENEDEDGADVDDSLALVQDDGELEVQSSENSQELEKRIGKELKKAARKFREVDQWELDFEEVTASSDSPRERDAR